MNKWIKFPLIFGLIFAVLGIFFYPIKILKIQIISQNLLSIFNSAGIIDGLILGILLGLVIAFFKKERNYFQRHLAKPY